MMVCRCMNTIEYSRVVVDCMKSITIRGMRRRRRNSGKLGRW
jgi:hypothetical protein